MRNVLVFGAASPLGHGLLAHLRERPGVERVVGVESAASSEWMEGVELVALGEDHRELSAFLDAHAIDTVIHCGLAPDRSGAQATPCEAKVIDTMRLGVAIGHAGSPVRSWVVAASGAVYPACSHAPLLHRENGELERAEGTLAASLLEAEDYARDVARHAPQVNVAILRLQQLVGAGVQSPICSVLRQPILPVPLGFDPPLQLLSLEDAVRALVWAAKIELAGVYNLASAGVLRFSEARALLGKRSLPVLPIEAGPLASLARGLGAPYVPDGLLPLLRFGQALDTSKLAAAGFEPHYEQAECLALVGS